MPRHLSLLHVSMLVAVAPIAAAAQSPDHVAAAVDREVTRISATTQLWPRFHPAAIPLALYTGTRTFLFRHPSPPAEFTTEGGVASMKGRHPSVTSNSNAQVGGVATATVLADGPRGLRSSRELAAVAIHEAFHVFQRVKHPGWQANEGELFTYPFERGDLLRLRREESDLIRRALATTGARSACFARGAIARRDERFRGLSAAQMAYERKSELNEGLATYVQLRALGATTVEIPAAEYPATQLRDRFYTIGPALAFLLDRARPGWVAELEEVDTLSLDGLLSGALARMSARVPCPVPREASRAIARAAQRDAGNVLTARAEAREAFDALPGWRVIVAVAPGAPLWPQGFDPLNVTTVAGGVRHDRMLKLGNDSISVSMIDESEVDLTAFTEAAGTHPLFNGVRRVAVHGLMQPAVRSEGGVTTVSAPGFVATVRGASVVERVAERRITITVVKS